MHLETLQTFCDLIETGSFSKAAELNLVSQSAVSQQIKMLENRFDTVLIERSVRRKVEPTPAGRQVYAACQEIIQRFESLEIQLKSKDQTVAGTVRLATVYSVGLHELPPYVKQFIQMYPQVNVHVEYARTNNIYEACLNNSIDFGIVAMPQRKPQLEIIHLRDAALVMICSPEHKLAKKKKVKLSQLQDETFIAFEKDIPTRKEIDRILKTHRVNVKTVMEFDNIETIKRSVEAGNGISILPETVVTAEVRTQQLIALKFADGEFKRSVGIIFRKGKVLSAAAKEFIELVRK
jgi:LysR family transcriptional regulator, transcriptional activator of the cysJI operon